MVTINEKKKKKKKKIASGKTGRSIARNKQLQSQQPQVDAAASTKNSKGRNQPLDTFSASCSICPPTRRGAACECAHQAPQHATAPPRHGHRPKTCMLACVVLFPTAWSRSRHSQHDPPFPKFFCCCTVHFLIIVRISHGGKEAMDGNFTPR